MKPMLDDNDWSRIAAHFVPAIVSDCAHGLAVRSRIEDTLALTRAFYREKGEKPDPLKCFDAYAAAGDHFLKGITGLNQYYRAVMIVDKRLTGRVHEPVSIGKGVISEIESIVGLMKKLHTHIENAGKKLEINQKGKDWQHECLLMLLEIWDEEGQASRTKKEFLAFAFEVMQPCGIGVTEAGLLESFDRHVAPRRGFMAQNRARRARQTPQ
jgi:hypothetical protein